MSLFKDKRIVYGLLAGTAAIVAAAVASHYFSQTAEADPSMEIGPLRRDASGMIDFEQFIEILIQSNKAAKTQFAAQKKKFVTDRRAVFSDPQAYQKIVMQMQQEEEVVINGKLAMIMEQLGIEEADLQKNMMYHMGTQQKQMRIMQVQKDSMAATSGTVLSKEETLKCVKCQHDLQYKSMETMLKGGNQADQMQMMMQAMVEQYIAQDKLFFETGVEEDQLLYSIKELKLEEDMEYKKLQAEFEMKMQQLVMQTQGMGMGGPMGGMGGQMPMF